MKATFILAASLLTWHSLAEAHAQSPREQFQNAVAAYQKETTTANALKVIELFKQLDPAPAVPEEAREPFVMGATVLKESNAATGAAKAVELFGKAIHLAPWWSEARYNRALALEASGQLGNATNDLKIYLTFKLTDSERREAQDKIYALRAKAEIAATKKTEEEKAAAAKAAADTPQAREAALLQKVEGAMFVSDNGNPHTPTSPHASFEDIFEVKDGTLFQSLRIYSMGRGNTRLLSIHGHDQPGSYSIAKASYRDGSFTISAGGGAQVYRVRPDGQALTTEGGIYMQGYVKVISKQ